MVRKFDARGRVVAQISRRGEDVPPLPEVYAEDPEPSVYPLVRDIVVTGAHIGVVLNRGIDTAIFMDVWTTTGEFVKRVLVPAPSAVRALGRGDGTVDFLQVDGSVVTVNMRALLEDQP